MFSFQVFPSGFAGEFFSIHYVGFGVFCFPVRDAEIGEVSAFQHIDDLEGFPEVI